MLHPSACLNPAFIIVPAQLPTAAALELYLQNPLLLATHPKKVAATAAQWPALNPAERFRLLYRLKGRVETLRRATAHTPTVVAHCISCQEVVAYLEAHAELLDDANEKTALRAFCYILHPLERAWLLTHLKTVCAAREAALWAQHEEAA